MLYCKSCHPPTVLLGGKLTPGRDIHCIDKCDLGWMRLKWSSHIFWSRVHTADPSTLLHFSTFHGGANLTLAQLVRWLGLVSSLMGLFDGSLPIHNASFIWSPVAFHCRLFWVNYYDDLFRRRGKLFLGVLGGILTNSTITVTQQCPHATVRYHPTYRFSVVSRQLFSHGQYRVAICSQSWRWSNDGVDERLTHFHTTLWKLPKGNIPLFIDVDRFLNLVHDNRAMLSTLCLELCELRCVHDRISACRIIIEMNSARSFGTLCSLFAYALHSV